MTNEFHSSLDFLGTPYKEYLQAKANYERLREELFGEVKRQIYTWIDARLNSADSIVFPIQGVSEQEDIRGTMIKNTVFITEVNKPAPEFFQGNRFVFQKFFGEKVDSCGRFEIAGKRLEMHYAKEKTDIIEKARYEGVRLKESLLFQALCRYLGEDFRGIFLYSASGATSFCRNYDGEESHTAERLGHWDYVDSSYKEEPSMYGYEPGVLDKLRELGIINPEQIHCDTIFRTSGANKVDNWEDATETNKSTRIVYSYVGSKLWIPKGVQYGTYDIAFAESDQTGEKILTPGELYKLAKIGGFIVLPHHLLQFSQKISEKVKILLDSSEGDFSLLQKIA